MKMSIKEIASNTYKKLWKMETDKKIFYSLLAFILIYLIAQLIRFYVI